MTRNLAEILTELPENIRYRTVFEILGHSTTMEEDKEGKRLIPREMLFDALENLPEQEEGWPSSDAAYIGNIATEASFRDDWELLRQCASELNGVAYQTKSIRDRKKAGGLYKKLAESPEGTKSDRTNAAWMLAEADVWELAAPLYESIEVWKKASVCYERAGNNHKAVEMAKKAGDADRAISLALKDKIYGKSWAAHVAAEMSRYETALELAEDDTHLKGWIAEMCGLGTEAVLFYQEAGSYKQMAEVAKRYGYEEAAEIAYKALIGRKMERGYPDEAGTFALKCELWEDLARVLLKGHYQNREFEDAYVAVLSGTHKDKRDLLQSAMDDSVQNLKFRSAALFAHYLGNEEQAEKYKTIGLLVRA